MKIAVVAPKSAERGGAENLYEGLVDALNRAGHSATLIEIWVDETNFEGILEAYCNCFYLNLDDYDLVISTKAPTYMVRHRNHISYLLHTIRVFYDMFELEFDPNDKERQRERKMIHELDKYGLSSQRIKKHFVNGSAVYKRMRDLDGYWNNIDFQTLHHPPKIDKFKEPIEGNIIFLPGRLHRWKRPDLVINSMKYVKYDVDLVITGRGEDEEYCRSLAKHDSRIKFLGWVDDESIVDLYSRAIVVPFVPINEDYGLITVEAFKSKKPVITCNDSGEPSLIVKDGVNGFVVDPDPMQIAAKVNYLIENPEEIKRMGENGYNSVKDITWDAVVSELMGDSDIMKLSDDVKPQINVLIIDMQPIEPAVGGGRLRLKGLYSNLPANINSLYVGTYDWRGEKARKIRVCDRLQELDIPLSEDHFKLNDYFNDLLPGKTLIDVLFPLLAESSKEYLSFVRSEARKADVIILSHPWLYPAIRTEINLKNKLLVYDSHNCEAILRNKILGEMPFARCLSQMVKFVERELCENCDLILACSEEDKNIFKHMYNINPDKIEIFPNGVFIEDNEPIDEMVKRNLKEKLQLNKKTATFIGSEYLPNVEAGKYIIENLAEKCPNVNFMILGGVGNALPENNKSNVMIKGVVTDEEKNLLYSVADIAINPMLSGSGTNIKMFDFLAAGLPTISSPVGARGIKNDGAFVVAELSNFSEKIQEIAENKKLREMLSSAGRTLVQRYYDWSNISSDLGKRINTLYLNQSPYFSIIVPMYREMDIKKYCDYFNKQKFHDFELIIVDSGKERGDAFYKECNSKLKYIFEKNVGAVGARNLGIKYARGKIIAFTDDDCQPDPDWLDNAKKYFEEENVVGLEGYIYTDETKLNNPKYRIVTNKGFEGIGFMTANLFIRHEILKQSGNFDERFDKPHFREDTELAWRVQKHGLIPFAKDVRVYHPPHLRKSIGESQNERDRFFINDVILFKEYPDKYINLMKAEEHFIKNPNYWKFFLEGCQRNKGEIPIKYMLRDPGICMHIPDKIKLELEKLSAQTL